jgi:tRNA pseudouridine38-40 synthase
MRYLLKLTYNGTLYHGWQMQPNAVTVQGVLNEMLSQIFDVAVPTVGCGRTDTGVHARMFYVHFDNENELHENFLGRLNFLLPHDIRVHEVYRVAPDFNARYEALSRSYEYCVNFVADPFIDKYSLLLHKKPDFELMNKSAIKLLDHNIFTSFSKSGGDNKTDICKITEAEWRPYEKDTWKFYITADRFLRGMVRAIVGTLLLLGYGKISEEDFIHIIESKDRAKAGESVAPYGLFLCDVKYKEEVFLICKD